MSFLYQNFSLDLRLFSYKVKLLIYFYCLLLSSLKLSGTFLYSQNYEF